MGLCSWICCYCIIGKFNSIAIRKKITSSLYATNVWTLFEHRNRDEVFKAPFYQYLRLSKTVRFRSAAWPETLDFQGFFWCLDIFTPFWNTSYLTPKWILTSDLTADTKYLSSFKIIFWYNIHFFYSWKLEFPCLIVSKVALSKIKVK